MPPMIIFLYDGATICYGGVHMTLTVLFLFFEKQKMYVKWPNMKIAVSREHMKNIRWLTLKGKIFWERNVAKFRKQILPNSLSRDFSGCTFY